LALRQYSRFSCIEVQSPYIALEWRASVLMYALVVVSDGLFRVKTEKHCAFVQFVSIGHRLPMELQWVLAKHAAGTTTSRIWDEGALTWLLKLLYDNYYTD